MPTLKKLYSTIENNYYHEDEKELEELTKQHEVNKNISHKGKIGLSNLGNTCFMNSVIQCLSNIQPLQDYIEAEYYKSEINEANPLGSKGYIAWAFTNLIKQMWNSQSQIIQPSEFLKIVQFINEKYIFQEQEDAQEFLIFLLDMLHEDLNRVEHAKYIEQKEHTVELNEMEQEKLAADSWKDYLLRNKSVIIDLFQGQLKNSIKCQECGFKKFKFDPFMYLSLPIEDIQKQQKITVQECLQKFLKEETLDNDEKWMCPKCNKLVVATKKIDIWKLPNILMIVFKRFMIKKNLIQKINSCIEFESDNFSLADFVPEQLQKSHSVYDLFAALTHQGTLNSGHYTAYAKNKEDFQWYHFNDSVVKSIDDPENKIPGSNVYMLFYQKSSIDLIKRQSITKPNYWPHMIQNSQNNKN